MTRLALVRLTLALRRDDDEEADGAALAWRAAEAIKAEIMRAMRETPREPLGRIAMTVALIGERQAGLTAADTG